MTSWGDSSSPRPTQDRSKSSLAGMLKQQFRQLVKVLTDREPAPAPKRKTRRTEETRRGFKMARDLTQKITRSLLHFLYRPSSYDPEQERAYAEHVLRTQMEEWTQESEQQQDEAFHYARAAGFDHQP
jgi:hypothetical protein